MDIKMFEFFKRKEKDIYYPPLAGHYIEESKIIKFTERNIEKLHIFVDKNESISFYKESYPNNIFLFYIRSCIMKDDYYEPAIKKGDICYSVIRNDKIQFILQEGSFHNIKNKIKYLIKEKEEMSDITSFMNFLDTTI
ncbi:MAG: hypothetical protein [Caudoviricetes sp.]|nr:MAG: hypothetical protein [Caudoviricetes sp.]